MKENEMKLLQELLDREAIKEVKARYCRFLDTKDWKGFRSLFADDCTYQVEDFEPIMKGADNFVAMAREKLGDKSTRTAHHMHTPEITFVSPTEASVTHALADYIEWASLENGVRVGFKGFARYYETYKKIDGEWRIATWRLTYTRLDPLWPDPLPTEIPEAPFEWGNIVARKTSIPKKQAGR